MANRSIACDTNTFRGWGVDKASVPIGAEHFRPDVNVYAISNFLPLSFVLDNLFLYQIVRNQILYRNMYFKYRINTRETTYLCQRKKKKKVYCNNYAFFSLGDIVNKVTLQITIPKYSRLNLHNTSIFKENVGHHCRSRE